MRKCQSRKGAALAALLASLGSNASTQPLVGTHEPRTYDEALIPRFSFEVIELDARGTLGVAVLDTQSGLQTAWRGG